MQDFTFERNRGKQNKRKLSNQQGIKASDEEQHPEPIVIDTTEDDGTNKNKEKKIVIDTTEDDGTNKNKEKKTVPFSLKTAIARLLTQQVRDKLKNIHKEGGLLSTVWKASSNEVIISLEDINFLLRESEVSNFVIDTYGILLFEKQTEMENRQENLMNKSYYLPCFSLDMFDLKDKDKEDHALNRHLERASKGYNLLFFPLNHNNFHWTLLLFDRINGEWYHYNSLLPRTKETRDPYFENCGTVKIYMEEFYNCHDTKKVDGKSEILPIFNDLKSPQQIYGSLDCGLFVCLYMKFLSEHGHSEERKCVQCKCIRCAGTNYTNYPP